MNQVGTAPSLSPFRSMATGAPAPSSRWGLPSPLTWILLGGILQWIEYAQYYFPLVLLTIPSLTMCVYIAACVWGLFVRARTFGRSPWWATLGLVPVFGFITCLAVLGRGPEHWVREPRPQRPLHRRVLHGVLMFLVWVLGVTAVGSYIALQPLQVSKYSPDRTARVSVHGIGYASIAIQERWGIFLISHRHLLTARDFAVVKRAIWAKDSSRFLLIGSDSDTSWDVKVRVPNTKGWFLAFFVMYDRPSDVLWFNSKYRGTLPTFTLADVQDIDWAEPFSLHEDL